jgi:hypothetical protein
MSRLASSADGSIFLVQQAPFRAKMSFLRLIMHTIAYSLIACWWLANCCAVVFLLLEKRTRDAQKKIFEKNLEEINYYLRGYTLKAAAGSLTDL